MYLTKIVVFVAHDEALEPPTERLIDLINTAIGSEHAFDPMLIEVCDHGTTEVNLAMIDYSLEHGQRVEAVKREKDEKDGESGG